MVALYRKWRPEIWADLVGQEHISRTLINAIETSKLSHAYMFCGSRGTGKTTTARILAKALNCENRVNGSPCNNCPSCQEISLGASLDIIEIDAASNRGIGEIKSLIEQVRFASVSGKYKVYIIDEFHMLTTEAFNALLKTLEEPPAKVIFILATTEAHKILPTIVSRCQRFDFQRIPVSILLQRIKYVAEQEKIEISDESLLAISRKANGGLRDALGLLDQISSFSIGEGKIPEDLVNQVLGLVSVGFLVELVEGIAKKDHMAVIETLNKLLKAGNDPNVIVSETITFFRHLLIVKSAPLSAELLEVPVTNLEHYKKTAELFSVQEIIGKLDFLNEVSDKIKKTQTAQLWLEVNFVILCKNTNVNVEKIETNSANTVVTNNSSEINFLMNKVKELESKLEKLAVSGTSFNISNFSHLNDNVTVKEESTTTEEPQTTEFLPKTSNFSEHDMKSLWERILVETKKKSIPTHAILAHGFLAEVDQKHHTITVIFDSDGYIELLKTKHGRIEQALASIFGASYKVISEKGKKEDKKKSFTQSKENTNNIVDFPSQKNIVTNDSTEILPKDIFTENKENHSESQPEFEDKPIEKRQEPQNDAPPFEVEKKNSESANLNVKDHALDYVTEEYTLDTEETSDLKIKKDRYFFEVADIFKGKIITNKE